MDLNLTLLGEMITFIIFILVTMKYIWPPLVKVMEERQKKIAEGIAAGERGHQALDQANKQASHLLSKAKQDGMHIIDQANIRSAKILEDAKAESLAQGNQIIASAQVEVAQQALLAKEALRKNVVELAVLAAEKIIRKDIDIKVHEHMLDQLIKTIETH